LDGSASKGIDIAEGSAYTSGQVAVAVLLLAAGGFGGAIGRRKRCAVGG
jgi:hypothetical protein